VKHSRVVAIEKLVTGEYAFCRFFDGGSKRDGPFTAVSDATEQRIFKLLENYNWEHVEYVPNMEHLVTDRFYF